MKGVLKLRKYFVKYGEFANTYAVCYTENIEEEAEAIGQGMKRISRKEAIELCVRESERRKENPAFAGYASDVILPFGYDGDWTNDRSFEKIGRLIERRRP